MDADSLCPGSVAIMSKCRKDCNNSIRLLSVDLEQYFCIC